MIVHLINLNNSIEKIAKAVLESRGDGACVLIRIHFLGSNKNEKLCSNHCDDWHYEIEKYLDLQFAIQEEKMICSTASFVKGQREPDTYELCDNWKEELSRIRLELDMSVRKYFEQRKVPNYSNDPIVFHEIKKVNYTGANTTL